MLVGAAVCPHPPLLVPEVAGAAAAELDSLRAACREAISRLPSSLDLLAVVGADEATRTYPPDAAGSLRPYGVELAVGGPGEPVLPLSLTIGRWLLDRSGPPGTAARTGSARVRFQGVAEGAAPEECLLLGRELAAAAPRVGMLVMGDGSACRADAAAAELDPRAGPYDAAVARALRDADAGALAALDPARSSELQAAGRAAWQVLAGAAGAGAAGAGADGAAGAGAEGGAEEGGVAFAGSVLADAAPYGVGYFVASWLRGPRGSAATERDPGPGGYPP